MNINKEKMQISSSRALLIFIATTIVLELIIYFIQAILLKYTNVSNTFYKWYETIYKINEYFPHLLHYHFQNQASQININ